MDEYCAVLEARQPVRRVLGFLKDSVEDASLAAPAVKGCVRVLTARV